MLLAHRGGGGGHEGAVIGVAVGLGEGHAAVVVGVGRAPQPHHQVVGEVGRTERVRLLAQLAGRRGGQHRHARGVELVDRVVGGVRRRRQALDPGDGACLAGVEDGHGDRGGQGQQAPAQLQEVDLPRPEVEGPGPGVARVVKQKEGLLALAGVGLELALDRGEGALELRRARGRSSAGCCCRGSRPAGLPLAQKDKERAPKGDVTGEQRSSGSRWSSRGIRRRGRWSCTDSLPR